MSYAYDEYLRNHKRNVKKAFDWIQKYMPYLLESRPAYEYFIVEHDDSKYCSDEYVAYDEYFYGDVRTKEITENFRKAWLTHIHRNPHHWQYWVLFNEDPTLQYPEYEQLQMPNRYVIEMICDWWSFSWGKGDLSLIFGWYEEHKSSMKLHPATELRVTEILKDLLNKLYDVYVKDTLLEYAQ